MLENDTYRCSDYVPRSFFNRRTLIIGSGSAGSKAAKLLAEYGHGKYQIIGFMDDNPDKEGADLNIGSSGVPGYKVLGNRHALPKLISQHRINTLILAINQEVDGKLLETLMDSLGK